MTYHHVRMSRSEMTWRATARHKNWVESRITYYSWKLKKFCVKIQKKFVRLEKSDGNQKFP